MKLAFVGKGGSGKTTLAFKFYDALISMRHTAVYLSADLFRWQLTGNESDQSVTVEAWELSTKLWLNWQAASMWWSLMVFSTSFLIAKILSGMLIVITTK